MLGIGWSLVCEESRVKRRREWTSCTDSKSQIYFDVFRIDLCTKHRDLMSIFPIGRL